MCMKFICFNAARGFVCGATRARTTRMDTTFTVSMPHAALWVVQLSTSLMFKVRTIRFNAARGFVGGAAKMKKIYVIEEWGFNAARGFVGGATVRKECTYEKGVVSMPHAAIPFRPHHRFAVPLPRSRRGGFSFTACRFLRPMCGMRAAAKSRRSVKGYGILASPADAGERSTSANHTSFYSYSWDVFPYDLFPVQLCPMGLLLGQVSKWRAQRADRGAHAARGFVGGAATPCAARRRAHRVSMPHAALWVVQPRPR